MIVAIVDSIPLNKVDDPSVNQMGRYTGPDSTPIEKYTARTYEQYQ